MADKKPTAGIVLAAGTSSRLGRPKQLMVLGGKPLLEWTLDACLGAQLERIFLVLGHQRQRIMDRLSTKLAQQRIQVVINREYPFGQSTSLRAGIAQIRNRFPSAMFILGDQPLIDAPTLNTLLVRFWASNKHICVPVHHFQRGNPVIFSSLFYDLIDGIHGDVGARQIIEDNPDQVLKIAVKRRAFFHDADTEGDLRRLAGYFETIGKKGRDDGP